MAASEATPQPTIFELARRGDIGAVLQGAVGRGELAGDVDAPDGSGNSCLYYAALCGHEKLVSALLGKVSNLSSLA